MTSITRLNSGSRAKRWSFTVNNYTLNDELALKRLCGIFDAPDPGESEPLVDYLIYGRELASTGTPHLQGYLIWKTDCRLVTCRNRMGLVTAPHLEVSRGSPEQNRVYCSKEDETPFEYGTCPAVSQGRRSDLERFFDWADEFSLEHGRAPTTPEAAKLFPVVVVKHGRLMDVVRLRTQRALFHAEPDPREWQQRLRDTLDQPPDDRKIQFVIDYDGGIGKSWFVRWYLDMHPTTTQLFRPGKVADLAHAIKIHCNVFLFDIPRDGLQYLQTQVLEMLKDRVIFSPKYNSTTKYLTAVPHVVVFTNEHPDDVGIKLTADRYSFVKID